MSNLDLLLAYAASAETGGIATARPYVESMAKGLSSADFDKLIKAAEECLTHSSRELIVKSFTESDDDSFWDADIPAGSIFAYDAVLATKDKDRDGDIVHPEGLTLETKMPLLWQHIQTQPIGVMVKMLEQSSDELINRYAIADTELGRDAATLVKMGALRKSHGFFPVPGQFQPIDIITKADGSKQATGFEIFKANVFESSLVSIPAGAKARVIRTYEKEFDAICTAHSRDVLKSGLVKQWAESLYGSRQKVFAGASAADATVKTVTTEAPNGTPNITVNVSIPDLAVKSMQPKGIKSFAESLSVKMAGTPDHMPGSFEEVQAAIGRQAERYLKQNVQGFRCDYAFVSATFGDSAIICCRTYDRDTYEYGKPRCYRVMWSYGDDGEVTLSGTPQEVEMAVSVVEKSISMQTIDWKEPPSRKDAGILPAVKQSTGSTDAAVASSDPIFDLFGLQTLGE